MFRESRLDERCARVAIHRLEVFLNHRLAALAVGFLNGLFDRFNGIFTRQNSADGEEAGLHDGVDAIAHAGIARHFVAVDHKKSQVFLDDLILDLAWKMIPHFAGAKGSSSAETWRPVRQRRGRPCVRGN